jgi:hypothetical protein
VPLESRDELAIGRVKRLLEALASPVPKANYLTTKTGDPYYWDARFTSA